ncbi:XkdX family protein [Fructobacillus durionis]|uniref:Phage uncharacterized protein (Phage_XkdX) n=1 Tax=Fructobacillus durionis TaxID=283737 RepID=A0A1I1HP21_9LACO|nr:XkdX family protein [Fructobacillus durionis]SFC25312.1 Phage uncharacterised protein (Phage_XkdX) [Fructobacillus durionis]
MELSKTGQTINYFYNNQGWTLKQVTNTVKVGWISKDEFQEITGQEFTE